MESERRVPEEGLITGEQLLRMADVGPCELVDGRIVPMTPTGGEHGRVELKIAAAIDKYVSASGIAGHVMVGEVGIYTRRRPDRVRAADVLFISDARYRRQRDPKGFLEVAPELVIEILSPGDSAIQVGQKLREYFETGVVVVLVVDPGARRLRIHRSPTDAVDLTDRDSLSLPDVLPGFEVRVADLFAV
jgi:Uma2 family endonuclease